GSAVATVPAEDMSMAYLSSGTWSLMGVMSPEPVITERSQQLNFTNEGGVGGTIRVLKNICGMWLLERCRAEWGEIGYGELIAQAEKAEPFRSIINPDAPCFANPESMTAAIDGYCEATNQPVPSCIGEYVRTIFESLALRYRQVVGMLSEFTGVKVEQLYVIGGGAKNDMLNQFSSNAIGVPVTTGASEATAWGNIAVQAESTKQCGGFAEIMQMCSPLLESKHYEPQDKELWQQGYEKFLSVYKEI
ncbi:MAG: rhamnulokinase, partial [Alistipes sp.]|nr:rhamnulokinase [Alistipes sp.]